MNRFKPMSALRRKNSRRPAGISRRQKRKMLSFETLEDRRVMSATHNIGGLDFTDSQVRELLLDGPTLNEFAEAADLSQYSNLQLDLTNEWIVLAAEGVDASELAAATGVAIAGETGVVPWSYIVDASSSSSDEVVASLTNSELVDYFYPLVPIAIESLATTNDEFLDKQWGLINFGQDTGNPDFAPIFGTVDEDINIEEAWDLATGQGVVIGIVDEGVLESHPDLADNIRTDLSIDLALGSPAGGIPTGNDAHGTAVAGIAAAVGDNEIGIAGVAYEADIAPIRLFTSANGYALTDATVAASFLHEAQQIDVYNHSWGFVPPTDDDGNLVNPRSIIALGPLATTALRNSVFFGRGGLGGIHVFSAGNSVGIEDSGNYSETVNSRYTIGVTSVIEDGGPTTYAESSAATLVAAPSGSNPLEIIRDEELGSGIYTTDLLGDDGYNESGGIFGIEIDADFEENTDYSSRFNGTSASAPFVSGVIALMLEANPNLTYRDVQHILVRSARQNSPEDVSWITNYSELFNDPLAFDSDPEDAIFDGDWPRAVPAGEGDPGADPPVAATTNTQIYYQEPTLPAQFTNGAGLTVSHISARVEEGYGHGVVDASLAVLLASNWVTLGPQTSEFTATTGAIIAGQINASMISSEEAGEIRVPGGVVGDGNPDNPNAFIDFFNEFAAEDTPGDPGDPGADPPVDPTDPEGPFLGDDPPINTRGTYIPIAAPAMTVEWVEVELNLTAGDANDYDFLRIVLVSPDGTQSDLKNFSIPNLDGGILHDVALGPAGDPVGNFTNDSNALNAVFTTNRHWGERTESKVRLNTDGTPVNSFVPLITAKTVDNVPNPEGFPITDGWKLVFENYGDSAINISTYEVAFHGINAAGTGRIQGTIGVDDNGDGVFSDDLGLESNFTRYNELNVLDALVDPDFDPFSITNPTSFSDAFLLFSLAGETFPLTNDTQAYADVVSADNYIIREQLTSDVQESWAAGAIVYVDLDLNGVRDFTDPSFQLGHDGNYYFDLPPGDYDVRIDPASLDAAGLLNQANLDLVNAGPVAQVTVAEAGERIDGFNVVNPFEDPAIDGDENSFLRRTSVPELNVLLVANSVPDNIVNLSGVVYADLDLNGINNGVDAPIGGADVFIDVNQNGVFTPGFDLFTTTAADGSYSFVDVEITPGFYSVIVLEGSTGTFNSPVNPDDATRSFFFEPELVRTDLDFGFEIDPNVPGGNSFVAISGVIFEDANANGARGINEDVLENIATVYLDLNDNNQYDPATEPQSTTENGTFIFNSLLPGQYVVRIEFDDIQFEQTTPAGLPDLNGDFDPDDFETRVTVAGGNVAGGIDFGLRNLAVLDYGDLPSAFYPTTAAQNGASHVVFGDLFLGARVDKELDAPADSDGTGDDTTGVDDEDGVRFGSYDASTGIFTELDLADNATTIDIEITANTNGGFLQAWMDFNEDHIFQASEHIITETLINSGVTVFEDIPIPANLTDGTVFARFRYGEQGIAGFDGPAQKGEVEDYAIPVLSTAIDPGLIVIADSADFDSDGDVDGSDFLAWQRGFGTSSPSPADGDANDDGSVDGADLATWTEDYGTGTSNSGGGTNALGAAFAPISSLLSETSSDQASSTSGVPTLGPRMYQPGFPEVLPEDAPLTSEFDTASVRLEQAAVLGRVATRSTYARQDRVVDGAEQQVDAEQIARPFEARDEVFARRQERIERRAAWNVAETDEVEALAVALDEEVDWLQI